MDKKAKKTEKIQTSELLLKAASLRNKAGQFLPPAVGSLMATDKLVGFFFCITPTAGE